MRNYIFFPEAVKKECYLTSEWKQWMEEWLYTVVENIERGIISSAECVQGLFSEILLYGRPKTDWCCVEHDLLRDDSGNPIAYSENYGRRLYHFEKQWKQMTVYAIYNSFYLNDYYREDGRVWYDKVIRRLIQPNGWIYNKCVSSTQIRTRMKSELFMSFAMGIEILCEEGLTREEENCFEAVLATIPLTGYISAEFFRNRALQAIENAYQFPEGIQEMLQRCEAEAGYNDFCVLDKVDDYMGTNKRVQHDSIIHTPLISNMAGVLSRLCSDEYERYVEARLKEYAAYLLENPMHLPAFTMRDIDLPFGQGITPVEVISSVLIVNKNKVG